MDAIPRHRGGLRIGREALSASRDHRASDLYRLAAGPDAAASLRRSSQRRSLPWAKLSGLPASFTPLVSVRWCAKSSPDQLLSRQDLVCAIRFAYSRACCAIRFEAGAPRS
jgi:hypothetical protein